MEYSINSYKFVVEYDFDETSNIIVSVFYEGNPLYKNNSTTHQVRRQFASADSMEHIRNFCNRFAEDVSYRNRLLPLL